jgi:hypothetical protein
MLGINWRNSFPLNPPPPPYYPIFPPKHVIQFEMAEDDIGTMESPWSTTVCAINIQYKGTNFLHLLVTNLKAEI